MSDLDAVEREAQHDYYDALPGLDDERPTRSECEEPARVAHGGPSPVEHLPRAELERELARGAGLRPLRARAELLRRDGDPQRCLFDV